MGRLSGLFGTKFVDGARDRRQVASQSLIQST
jgi:hypothetical protein